MEKKILETLSAIDDLQKQFYIDERNCDENIMQCISLIDDIFQNLLFLFKDDEDAIQLLEVIDCCSNQIVDALTYKDYLQLIDILSVEVVNILKGLLNEE